MWLMARLSLTARKRLGAAPWTEVRPGVLVRELDEAGSNYLQMTFVCQACRCGLVSKNEAPMLDDELWKLHYPQNGVVCRGCMEKKLEREIELQDLRPCWSTLQVLVVHYPLLVAQLGLSSCPYKWVAWLSKQRKME